MIPVAILTIVVVVLLILIIRHHTTTPTLIFAILSGIGFVAATTWGAAAYDNLDTMLVHGGRGQAGLLDDLWSWDNLRSQWEQLDGAHSEGPAGGVRPAARRGHVDIAEWLIRRRANVKTESGSGNTALHTAAFFCHVEMVALLLKHGASVKAKNKRGQTPLDVVSAKWSRRLARTYRSIDKDVDLERIERIRPKIAEMLR